MRRKENEIDLGSFPTLKWLQLVIVGLAVFLSSLDVTVNVAPVSYTHLTLPTILLV